ncbi:transporter substrate-binding domain-containing protein [Chitinilyticum litopenaei]|uniref:transporter substrate-binding domain-containing protein n=1 Tax=Chitinilyticum litopenaei TaxID=1121276 RepID=UPI00130E9EE6|nr:transporter substrate-binding domain-containing protein [Chitinilyticum litopenaei]
MIPRPNGLSGFKHGLLALLACLLPGLVLADRLDDIKARGSLQVGVNVDVPPFAQRGKDGASGYDVDFALAIGKRLGVPVIVRDVQPDQRIEVLKSGKVDLIIAAFSKTREREREVLFSTGYFISSQKVLAPRGKYTSQDALAKANIGVVRGTTGAAAVRRQLPGATVVDFDDSPQMVRFLAEGRLDAVSDDEATLAGLLLKMPNRDKFALSDYNLNLDIFGIAMNKGETRLQKLVNETLLELERSGEAERIYNRWFGPQSGNPMPRTFRIQGGG